MGILKQIKGSLAILSSIVLLALSTDEPHVLSAQEKSESKIANSHDLPLPPVLSYHEIRAKELHNEFDVSLAELRWQLDWLQEAGYRTLTVPEIEKAITSGDLNSLEKGILLTFDDGYLGTLNYAVPELRQRGMHGTFFIHTHALERDTPIPNYPQMSWPQVLDLDADPLFTVYSHTLTHPNLTQLEDRRLQKELEGSRAIFQEKLGGQRTALSYPMGFYDQRVIEASQDAGYTMAFAIFDLGQFDQPIQYSIPRIYMGTIMENRQFFIDCVRTYSLRPQACFAERWQPLSSPLDLTDSGSS